MRCISSQRNRFLIFRYENFCPLSFDAVAQLGRRGLNPFAPVEGGDLETFKSTAEAIFGGSKLLTDDLMAMNTALINGEIDAYFTGGTYTASPARFDGATNVRAITPNSGPVDGKGGVAWIELTSAVNNPDPSNLAEDFLEFVQSPEISKAVSFTEGTYNPVSQMGNPEVMALFNSEELDAIQMDTLADEMARSLDYKVVSPYDALIDIYTAVRRS